MSFHYKSGAQKRRETKAKDKEVYKNQQTLHSLGFIAHSASASSASKNVTANNEVPQQQDFTVDIASSGTATEVMETNASYAIAREVEDLVKQQEKKKSVNDYDIGVLELDIISTDDIEEAIKHGPQSFPQSIPQDETGYTFPITLLHTRMKNCEKLARDWLVWSHVKQAVFCFPCRLFSKLPSACRSSLASHKGYSTCKKWKKLYNKVPEHESSTNHKECYLQWRQTEKRFSIESSIDHLLAKNLQSEIDYWRKILQRIIDVVLFLGERGLALRGNSHLIGDRQNGNFLGILELISHYDPLLNEHLAKVKRSQEQGNRMQVHYLSADSQNEFIQCCAQKVTAAIIDELQAAKYYSIIVDATPDSAHVEQTVFIIRYVHLEDMTEMFDIKERFLAFVDCNQKTGQAIKQLILDTLEKYSISLQNCRAQSYDNGSNMSGAYKGVQALLLQLNPLALFSPCACHSLNLCGVHAAECCPEVITFFGTLQKLYNIFSGSPQRWSILKDCTGCSLHSLSDTRWSARIDSVRAFVNSLPSLQLALSSFKDLNLTSETHADVDGVSKYLSSFDSVLLAVIWLKVLTSINYRSTVLQARDSTLDVEVENIYSLLDELKETRNSWDNLFSEAKSLAERCNVELIFTVAAQSKRRRRQRYADGTVADFEDINPEDKFKQTVFYPLMDSVISNLSRRYEAAKTLNSLFCVTWNYLIMDDEEIQISARKLSQEYSVDISDELHEELLHLKSIHIANLGNSALGPLQLLNKLRELKLHALFPNLLVVLRIFCTIPVTVAQAERSFSTLSRIKDVMRSTMSQDRLNGLGILAIEAQLARSIDYSCIIELFANRKARKAPLH